MIFFFPEQGPKAFRGQRDLAPQAQVDGWWYFCFCYWLVCLIPITWCRLFHLRPCLGGLQPIREGALPVGRWTLGSRHHCHAGTKRSSFPRGLSSTVTVLNWLSYTCGNEDHTENEAGFFMWLAFPVVKTPCEETSGCKSGHAFSYMASPLVRTDVRSQTYPWHVFSATLIWGC